MQYFLCCVGQCVLSLLLLYYYWRICMLFRVPAFEIEDSELWYFAVVLVHIILGLHTHLEHVYIFYPLFENHHDFTCGHDAVAKNKNACNSDHSVKSTGQEVIRYAGFP